MRLDDYLSTVGVVKRRTVAKKLADAKMIEVNGNRAKPAYNVSIKDIITIKGNNGRTIEVLDIPTGSVPKVERDKYFKVIPE